MAGLTDGVGGFTGLGGANGVAIAEISGKTYAVVAARDDDSVQIIDVTKPAAPVPVAGLTDGVGGFAGLGGAWDVAIAEISGKTYAVVAARDDDSVQVVDITDPASPVPVAGLTDGVGGFTELDGAWDVAIAEISDRTYAVVAAYLDDGIQIIDITDPDHLPYPSTAGSSATVSSAHGSSVPGCHNTNECYVPHTVTIVAGGTITWTNDDVAAHTVTSGVLEVGGPDGLFDSGLFVPGTEFSHTFLEAGEYPYFCLIHTWMEGLVVVE